MLWNVNAFKEFTFDGSKLNFDFSMSFSVSILLSVLIVLFDGNIFVPISFAGSFFTLSGLQHYIFYYIIY